MNYLDTWNKGFEEGKNLQLRLINTHTGMQFKSLTEVINYIREMEINKTLETENAQS
jgi:hypothetical protein